MGSDFSELDAELDSLETGPSVDALMLARIYAGASLELRVVDSALNEIDADGTLLRTRSSFPPEMPRRARKSERPEPSSEEIVLPDPVLREPQHRAPGSGEMPLHAVAERSGSLALDHQAAKRTPQLGRDDTLDAFDDELVEAELIELTPAPESPNDSTGERGSRSSLFEAKSLVDGRAQEEADAAFAELFSEATREGRREGTREGTMEAQSARSSQAPEHYEDTARFDSNELGLVENEIRIADVSMDEELDSAEFEIVVDRDVSNSLPPTEQSASDAPEKRPSFLGRLFGRKED